MLSSSKFPHACLQHWPYLCLLSAHHNNHITFHVTGLQRSVLIYLKFRNTIQHNTIHQDLWNRTITNTGNTPPITYIGDTWWLAPGWSPALPCTCGRCSGPGGLPHKVLSVQDQTGPAGSGHAPPCCGRRWGAQSIQWGTESQASQEDRRVLAVLHRGLRPGQESELGAC